mmetsp:Transcript_15804/g.50680  ORF Transcript_15804/g.50680 Transcript_15804/m.50680 type:complete len:306 (-) Transcript_15804:1654-2571(-)
MATSERWQVANPCAPLLCPLLSPLPLSRPPVSAASQLGRGRGEEPVAVQPARVLDGPPDRLAQRLLKGEGQLPSQLLELGPVERVTQVVTGSRVWPVVHLVDQLAAQLRRDEAGHLEVVELRLPLDVVLFAELGLVQHKEDRRGDVARMDVEARARAERAVIGVDDQLLAAKDARDAERDELLGVLPLAERVHHVHRHERHAVGVEVRLADHLGRRLGGRVRVGRLVRVPLLRQQGGRDGESSLLDVWESTLHTSTQLTAKQPETRPRLSADRRTRWGGVQHLGRPGSLNACPSSAEPNTSSVEK